MTATATSPRARPTDVGGLTPHVTECELTILMPCLNEAETLERCIRKAHDFLDRAGCAGEVLVGDNGSTDGSQAIARRCGARVVDVPVRGYGAAIHYGSLAARGRYVIVGDSDDSYDFSRLEPFLAALRGGHDLVMGNRFLGGIQPGAMPFLNRYLGNPTLTGLGRLFFQCPARDFHCGLRGYSTRAYRKLDLRTTGMEFASEMVIKATLMGMRVAEVPTTLHPDGRSRAPHLRPWRDGWRHLRFMLLYSPRWLFFYPGLILVALGVVGGAWLLGGARAVGGAVVDVHTLLYAAVAVLLGYQSVLFAVFTKTYAARKRLLPRSVRLERASRYLSLEAGLLCGLVMFVAGCACAAVALLGWRAQGYGPMSVQSTMRVVIPSALLLTLGTQTVFASFFLSVLGLEVRKLPEP